MKAYLKRAHALHDELVANRRHLHEHAEVGDELPMTTRYVAERLKEMGHEPVEIAKNALKAVVGGKKSGKAFLLRGDMDALPLQEESGLPFACKTGAAHACGHDLHTAMLLGAARMLKERENELHGTVTLMFQPAEEIFIGAKSMIDNGILKNPDVDAAFCIHVAADKPVGYLGYNKGYMMASTDAFQIDVHGKGCHGAMPHTGVDPINAAAHIHIALQEILSREISAAESAVITVGQFNAGTAMNIIPNLATMRGTIRAYSAATRELAIRRLKEIATGVAGTFNARADVEFAMGIPSVHCDKDMVEFMMAMLEGAGVEGFTLAERSSMGSEDFAFVAEAVPSAFLALGGALADESKRYAAHNPRIVFDEDCLPIGAAAYAAFAETWLKKQII